MVLAFDQLFGFKRAVEIVSSGERSGQCSTCCIYLHKRLLTASHLSLSLILLETSSMSMGVNLSDLYCL